MPNIDHKQKYELINYFLNEYCSKMEGTFFYEYISEIFFLTVHTRKIISTHNESPQYDSQMLSFLEPGYDKLTEYLSYPETLQIVREYIQDKLPQYAATFEECLNNGVINIVDSEDEFVEDKRNHQGYIRATGHHFANVALEHNYLDPTYLIHEFAHYLNNPDPDEVLTSTR